MNQLPDDELTEGYFQKRAQRGTHLMQAWGKLKVISVTD
jgi:hypothetical protein